MQIISSTTTSGAERHVLDLSRELVNRGHQVEVVTPKGGWLPQQLDVAGLPTTQRNMRKAGLLPTLAHVVWKLRRSKFDLIHSHLGRAAYFGLVGGKLGGVPAVATVHISNSDPVYRYLARGKNRLIAVSNYVGGTLRGRGVPSEFVTTIYNGTEFGAISRATEPQGENQPEALGIIGRVCPEKGHRELISAMRLVHDRFPEAKAYLIGRVVPSFENELETLLEESGIRNSIVLLGEQNDVASVLDRLQFTVLPSHCESFGIAAIESMARAKPVIASRVGGLPEIVTHGKTGLLVDLEPVAIADACIQLLSDPSRCQQLGSLAQKHVQENFTIQTMVNRIEELYYDVVKCR